MGIASKIKMVFAATTNMEDGFQLPKGPLGWLLAAGLGAGEKLNDAAIKFQCSRNPQNYYGPDYCPAAKITITSAMGTVVEWQPVIEGNDWTEVNMLVAETPYHIEVTSESNEEDFQALKACHWDVDTVNGSVIDLIEN